MALLFHPRLRFITTLVLTSFAEVRAWGNGQFGVWNNCPGSPTLTVPPNLAFAPGALSMGLGPGVHAYNVSGYVGFNNFTMYLSPSDDLSVAIPARSPLEAINFSTIGNPNETGGRISYGFDPRFPVPSYGHNGTGVTVINPLNCDVSDCPMVANGALQGAQNGGMSSCTTGCDIWIYTCFTSKFLRTSNYSLSSIALPTPSTMPSNGTN